MASAVEVKAGTFAPVPLKGLSGRNLVPFPLYLQGGAGSLLLYQPKNREFGASQEDRLSAEGIQRLFIREADREHYSRRIEHTLDLLLRDTTLSLDARAAMLVGVGKSVAADLFSGAPDTDGVERADYVIRCAAAFLVRDPSVLPVLRARLPNDGCGATHALSVGLLAMGLAQELGCSDPGELARVGLGGMLHDIGRAGRDPDDADHLHTARGHRFLRECNMPDEVCEVALFHHERFDGSGFPDGLVGGAIPFASGVVGLVDTFHRIYLDRPEGARIYDSLRVLAQVYAGCFDPEMTRALVRLFRGGGGRPSKRGQA